MDTSKIIPDTSKYALRSPEFFLALALISKAQAEGKRVQTRAHSSPPDRKWANNPSVRFNDTDRIHYRVEPEPPVLHVINDCDGDRVWEGYDPEEATQKLADKNARGTYTPYTMRRFREIVENT